MIAIKESRSRAHILCLYCNCRRPDDENPAVINPLEKYPGIFTNKTYHMLTDKPQMFVYIAVAFVKKYNHCIILSSIVVAKLYAGDKGYAEKNALQRFISLFRVVSPAYKT